jgi:hypothetical protein
MHLSFTYGTILTITANKGGIVGNLFYVTIIGGQLPPLMLKEWLLYLLCSIAMYGFGLLPLLAIIVGIVPYVKLKVKRI